ncbi:MAG: hypothetical protein IPM25_06575 [Chloracidobacterium sp.]|nr:hypothetical protein [Chloracidobacterium sp.]
MGILGVLGGILVLVGWIWAIVIAFKTSGALWGILNIIPIQPLIGIISAAMKKTAWLPVGLMIIGVILYWMGGGMAAMNP